MEVMSFNIWSDAPRNRSWPKRREQIATILHRPGLALAGLQEATMMMIRDLQDQLPQFRWVGVGRDDGREAGEFTPIFYRWDRFDLLDHGHFWLADPCDLPKRGWDALCHRTLTWAKLSERQSGQTITHFNTHFDHFGRKARVLSAQLIVRKMLEIAGAQPAILTGDLNSRESSAPYLFLTGRQPIAQKQAEEPALRDTHYDSASAPEGPRKTYRGFLGSLGLGRIDYVFVKNGLSTRRYRVLEAGAEASDHRPVVAEVAFTDTPPAITIGNGTEPPLLR